MVLLVMLAGQVLGATCKARVLRAGANILVPYATQNGKGCVLRTGLRSLRNWIKCLDVSRQDFILIHSHTYPSGEQVRFAVLLNQGDVAIKHHAPAAAPQEDNLTFIAFHHLL